MRFDAIDDLPLLVVHDRIDYQMTKLDSLRDPKQEERLKQQVMQEISRAFDLTAAPLLTSP